MITITNVGFKYHDFQFCNQEKIGGNSSGFISLFVTAKVAFIGLFVLISPPFSLYILNCPEMLNNVCAM